MGTNKPPCGAAETEPGSDHVHSCNREQHFTGFHRCGTCGQMF